MYNESTAKAIVSRSAFASIEDNADIHTIAFGNGSTASTSKELNISSTYRPAILPDKHCPNHLLPEKALSDLNCTTIFQRNTCSIVPPPSSNLKTIILTRNKDSHVFYADLQEIHSLMHDLQAQQEPPNDPTHYQVNSANLRKYTHDTIEYKVIELHEKMGHPHCDAMCSAVDGLDPAWKNTGVTAKQIRKVFSNYTCLPCAAAKRNLNPPSKRSEEDKKKWKPGECFSCDPAVKINPQGFEGSDCFFLFKDLATGYLMAVLTNSKKSSAFIDAFKHVLNHFAYYDHFPTKLLRTDSEVIFLSNEAKEFLCTNHIRSETSAPHCHYQVSVERDMQTLFKSLSTILNSQPYLRYDLWPLALSDYIERKNRTPNKRCHPRSPHQVITNTSTDLTREFTFKFGDIVLAGTPAVQRESKFDPRNEVGIYIGQEPGTSDTHRVFFPHNNKIKINGSVSKLDIHDAYLDKWITRRSKSSEPVYNMIEDALFDLFHPPNDAEPAAPVPVMNETLSGPAPALSPKESSQNFDESHARQIIGDNFYDQFTEEEKQTMLESRFLSLLEKFASLVMEQQQRKSTPRSNSPSAPNENPFGIASRTRRRISMSNVCLNDAHLLLPPQAKYEHNCIIFHE